MGLTGKVAERYQQIKKELLKDLNNTDIVEIGKRCAYLNGWLDCSLYITIEEGKNENK